MRSGIKPYASCRGAHSATDSALKLREKIGDYQSLEKIRIRCSNANFRTLGNIYPNTRLAAQMSLKEKMAYADYTVDNQDDLMELRKQVDQLWLVLTNLNS